jgi:hypothetical protein
MANMVYVGAVDEHRWVVTLDDDTTPISEHTSRGEAETSARTYAQTFGYPEIKVFGLDEEPEVIILNDPDPRPPYPGSAKGAPSG